MKTPIVTSALFLMFVVPTALAEGLMALPSHFPTTMEERGAAVSEIPQSKSEEVQIGELQQIETDFPTGQLSRIAQQPFSEAGARMRSAKDAEIYRAMSPSVVEILTRDGTGSGSLIGTSGEILTNYHVVQGYSDVGIIFKPLTEGKEPDAR